MIVSVPMDVRCENIKMLSISLDIEQGLSEYYFLVINNRNVDFFIILLNVQMKWSLPFPLWRNGTDS